MTHARIFALTSEFVDRIRSGLGAVFFGAAWILIPVALSSGDLTMATDIPSDRAGTPASGLTFEEHIRPIFKAACFHCHGEEKEKKGGLDVRLVRLLKAGGESGSALSPGDPEASLLWQRIHADEMPKGNKKLPPEQKEIVRRWIEQGALTARPEPGNVEEARFSFAELEHWAFQPVTTPALPTVKGYAVATPVDAFIAERLAEHRLPFSPGADRRTLIRRATFDLIGLPPTPEEVESFANDPAPDAYERLIERLLASPQFGVRWGRHWLDVAGFAESDGGAEGDPKRPHAWRYRDYVIEAFNQNRPIDEFYCEQLAGDEMVSGDLDSNNARQIELLTATGFLRMAPDPTQTSNTLADRNMAVADTVQVVSSSMLGLTVGCAQCHDHKYDPIGIDDYYRFRAVFDPAFPLKNWQTPNARLIDMTTAEVRAEAERIETQAKVIEDDLNARRNALGLEILERKIADVPEEMREAVRAAVHTPGDKRTPEQRDLLEQYPMVKPVSTILGLLVEYDGPSYRKFEKEQEKLAELRATKPPMRMIMATTEKAGVIPVSAVFFRGDPESPGEPVQPGELTVLNRNGRKVSLPENDPGRPTTGRRLAYARQLTDGQHPVAARVFVNRVWQHHFGRGLVASASDFGLSGEKPSHLKLLDWLASDFALHGWDQKRLHRFILLSTTYQQQSRRTPELDAIDPENELLARANLRRLEAEAVRDAILAVSGKLNLELGGPSIPVTENSEGKVVIGRQKIRDGLPAGVEGHEGGAFRRSIFIEVLRSLPLNVLATFDQPVMTPNCETRRHSTVATQSLWFLNDSFMVERAHDLAGRLFAEAAENSEERVRRLFVRLFAAPPTPAELASCQEFLVQQAEHFRNDSNTEKASKDQAPQPPPEVRALASLSQALLGSNRFLYVD